MRRQAYGSGRARALMVVKSFESPPPIINPLSIQLGKSVPPLSTNDHFHVIDFSASIGLIELCKNCHQEAVDAHAMGT